MKKSGFRIHYRQGDDAAFARVVDALYVLFGNDPDYPKTHRAGPVSSIRIFLPVSKEGKAPASSPTIATYGRLPAFRYRLVDLVLSAAGPVWAEPEDAGNPMSALPFAIPVRQVRPASAHEQLEALGLLQQVLTTGGVAPETALQLVS